MIAGKLKHSIGIQSYTISGTGDRGQPTKSYSTIATVRGSIVELTGRKLELARQLVATATHEITIRYYSGLTVDCRFTFNGSTYNIGHIGNKDNLNFQLVCLCTTQTTGT